MPDQQETPPTPLGIYDRTKTNTLTSIEVTALVLSALWMVGTFIFFARFQPIATEGAEDGTLKFIIVLLAVFLPVAMIWVTAIVARSSKVLREESRRLQAAIDAIRHAYVTQDQTRTTMIEPSVSKKLDEIAAAQRKTHSALTTFSSSRQPTSVRPAAKPDDNTLAKDDQVKLPLGTSAEDIQPPLERSDFIRALNFPETAQDKAGFAALRKALKDRQTAQLVQAAQDILTLMSHDGIYMDDLRPETARPDIWRRFAEGERGNPIAAIGGIRDRSSLALTAARMKRDTIYRDAAHHFLRLFDRMLMQFSQTATDTEMSELTDTRTARAFMLLGQVTGTFD